MTNFERIARRLRRDRPMVSVTLRMPEDVVEDLKQVAPVLGHCGYQPLIRFYIARGLREDLERLERPDLDALVTELKRRGLDEKALAKVAAAIRRQPK